jgi:tol-pal system protein YbgF
MMMRALSSLLVSAAMAAAAVPAHAGLFDDDEARKAILDLRQRIKDGDEEQRKRTEQVNEQVQQLQRSLLDLNNAIEALRGELSRMRGNDEQLARDIAELQRRQKDIAQGVDDRIRKLEPMKVTLDGREFSADAEEKRQFDEAMALFRNGDFNGAANAFSAFTRRYPSSGYTDASRFWLGNAQYGKRELKEAVTTLRAFVASAPDNPRAAEALLAIANCQIELKDTKTARRTLDELIKSYPQTEAALAGKERLAALR